MLAQEKTIRQKQLGVLLMVIGLVALTIILAYTTTRADRIKGFPELLPRRETLLYGEAPAALAPALTAYIKKEFGIAWGSQIGSWASGKVAVALLRPTDAEEDAPLFSFIFAESNSPEEAKKFLTLYQNPGQQVRETIQKDVTLYSTDRLHFAFIGSTAIISPSLEALTYLVHKQSSLEARLAEDTDLITIRRNIPGEFFAYARMQELPSSFYFSLQNIFAYVPQLVTPFEKVGVGFSITNNVWHGRSYSLLEKPLIVEHEQAYRASLLSFLPPDFDVMISGQGAPQYFKKMETLSGQTQRIKELFLNAYASDILFDEEIVPLVSKEFALTLGGEEFVFISEVRESSLEKIAATFEKITQHAGPWMSEKTREVVLPDGTIAKERIPAAENIESIEEKMGSHLLHGKRGRSSGKGLYYAFAYEKFFISNNLERLKEALQKTEVTGANFRETPLYRTMVQPILKNPELLGVTRLGQSVFAFSKRIMADHMETNFSLVVE